MSIKVTILGPAASSYVRTARMTCVEKGVAHVLEPIAPEAHAALHPWKKVPVLRHGDVQLFETSAITRYLDAIGEGPSLVPTSAAAQARMEQWISAINCYLYDALIRNYAFKYILPSFRGEPPDLDGARAAVPGLELGVGQLDGAYAGRTWIAGDAISLADLFVAPIARTISAFPEGQAALDKAPDLRRALAALAQRESFVIAHAHLER